MRPRLFLAGLGCAVGCGVLLLAAAAVGASDPADGAAAEVVLVGSYRLRSIRGPTAQVLHERTIDSRGWRDERVSYRLRVSDDPARNLAEYRFQLDYRHYAAAGAWVSDVRCRGTHAIRHEGPRDEEAGARIQRAATFPCRQLGTEPVPPGSEAVRVPMPYFLVGAYRAGKVGCRVSRREGERFAGVWGSGWREEVETVSISRFADAVLATGVWQTPWSEFVPSPGRTLALLARARDGAALQWRFALDPVSRLRGFAGNAETREDFARVVPSEHADALVPAYDPAGPDLRFLPDPEGRTRVHDDGTRLESAGASPELALEVAALDGGAYGHLRGRARFRRCENWQPVTIEVDAARRDHLTIPMDEDGNLMADRYGDLSWPFSYREPVGPDADGIPAPDGPEPDADDDGAPAGAGPGDGLTAFEEYRGFLATDPLYGGPEGRGEAAGAPPVATCPFLVRTSPRHKDLFVHAADPTLDALLGAFGRASGLAVRRPCRLQGPLDAAAARAGTDPSLRVVNFTTPGMLAGHALRRADQHALVVVDHALEDGTLGEVVPYDDAAWPWTPGGISQVRIDVAKNLALSPRELLATLLHELGHGVGVAHHGTGNLEKAVWLTRAPRCPPGTQALRRRRLAPPPGDGWRACLVESVARQWGQNSGDATCPMKYADWRWHELPDPPLRPAGRVDVRGHGRLPQFTGPLMRYEEELDEPGTAPFCTRTAGTGVNALPGARNHASDALAGPCATQIRVRDRAP